MSHAIIIISRVNNNMFHINIIMLRVDIIHLVCRKPKYATIHNKLISLKIHSKSKESTTPVFFSKHICEVYPIFFNFRRKYICIVRSRWLSTRWNHLNITFWLNNFSFVQGRSWEIPILVYSKYLQKSFRKKYSLIE